jgi:hypothetical protein
MGSTEKNYGFVLEYNPGDLADRLTILALKCKNCTDDSLKEGLEDEYNTLHNYWHTRFRPDFTVRALHEELAETNKSIWGLEAGIRNGDSLSLEEVGRRALEIRDINKKRVELKNKISEYYKFMMEVKINHRSE